jgi:hypothetical protein
MGVVLRASDPRRPAVWQNRKLLQLALAIVIFVLAIVILGVASGKYLYSSNDESQIFNGTVLKVGAQGSEACFAYSSGSARTRVCNQLFTSGVSIHKGEKVSFVIVTLHQGDITSHGFLVLIP